MAADSPGRVAVLLSGRGSNFAALHRRSLLPEANYRIVTVISDKKGAPGLELARQAGVPALHLAPRSFPDAAAFEREVAARLEEAGTELVCLAGYMRLVGPTLLGRFPGRILNIHPALLPSFPGLHAQAQALAWGVKVSGCTVHFVDSGMDTGPIVLQQAVAVEEGDDGESLSRRILEQEHLLYGRAVQLFFSGRLRLSGRHVTIAPP